MGLFLEGTYIRPERLIIGGKLAGLITGGKFVSKSLNVQLVILEVLARNS